MRKSKWFSAGVLMLLLLAVLSTSCRNKSSTGPDGDPTDPGTHSLQLRANDTLYWRQENLITVRVFQGNTVPANVIIRFRTESGIGYIDDNNGQTMYAQSDTIAHPCGANPCMDYHCDDTLVFKDAIFAYAVAHSETVATTSIGFILTH